MSDPAIKDFTIICDSREARSGIPGLLGSYKGVTVEMRDLLSGDYAVGRELGIERKTASDFVSSILDGRFIEQAVRMQSEFDRALLLVEGDVYNTRSIIKGESIDGAMSYLALLSGISVLHTPNVARSAALIYRLALHSTNGLGYEPPLRTGKPKDAKLNQVFLLEGLPGCGNKTAKKLLEHFGTPADVFFATEQQLRAVDGIGPALAKRIVEAVKGTPA